MGAVECGRLAGHCTMNQELRGRHKNIVGTWRHGLIYLQVDGELVPMASGGAFAEAQGVVVRDVGGKVIEAEDALGIVLASCGLHYTAEGQTACPTGIVARCNYV